MNELLREIEEDIRSEKLRNLWNSYGKTLVGVSIAVILGTAMGVAWNYWRQTEAERKTGQLLSGIERVEAGNYQEAVKAFEALAADPASPHYGIAMLRKALAQAAGGDRAGAMATYRELAERGKGNSRAFADLAGLLVVADQQAPIAPDADSPFYYTQREWYAWQLAEEGKSKEAAELFAALRADENTPPSQRQRVTLALEHMKVGMNDNTMSDGKKK